MTRYLITLVGPDGSSTVHAVTVRPTVPGWWRATDERGEVGHVGCGALAALAAWQRRELERGGAIVAVQETGP